MAKKSAPVVGPLMQPKPLPPEQKKPDLTVKPGKVKFKAKGECFLEGCLIEEPDQEILLFPAGAFRNRNNKNIEIVEGKIPILPEGTEIADFLATLEDGDPVVGPAPVGVRLIRQG